ncbi:hypothetical protein F66182_1661 [Fusarium sp. NRRL 66182]|nr:hypothetical protein F66182_1661 [Fusarium sp. NRRL 66182]
MKRPWKSPPSAGNIAQPANIQHPVRGRISGPVPIPTSLDDEFPIRNPGTNIASPVQGEFKESQPEPELLNGDARFKSPTFPEYRRNEPHTFRDESRSSMHARQLGTTARLQKAEPSGNVRHSFVSADRVNTRDRERPQRKQSTLRGALGKLFNRKKKTHGNDSANNTDSEAGSTATRQGPYRRSIGEDGQPEDSVPSLGLRDRLAPRSRSRPFPGAESKRSASLPITEFDRALRSHSIRPEDVRAIESARNSLSADFSLSQARVSATRLREYNLAGLSPRPASSHGRESRQEQHEENSNEIGRAITSDLPGMRRRSRSLSGLPEAEESHDSSRRRSDEIKYWRESYGPTFMAPILSNDQEDEGIASAGVEEARYDKEDHSQRMQAEPFNFGSFADMKQVGGMKITHAANLETRINNLESRVYRLEQVLDRVCDTVPNWRPQVEPPDRPIPPISAEERSKATWSGNRADQIKRYHVRDSSRSSGYQKTSQQRGSVFLDPHFSTTSDESDKDRPTSTATIRGATSLPNILKETPDAAPMDHYTTLLALIHTERSAREALEAQVKMLGHQLSIVSNSVAMTRGFDPPPTAKSFGDRSAFDHDDDDKIAILPHSRHTDPEDSGIGTGHGDESEYSESFETPREEGYGFGAFGEDLDQDDQAQTKAARTLSLSQLTMGKAPQNSSQHLRRVI